MFEQIKDLLVEELSLKPAHEMAEGDAHIDLLQIAGRLADVTLRVLEIEMIRAADPDDAPGLAVHGGGGQPNHLQRGLDLFIRLTEKGDVYTAFL